jgi:hypothetical protein
MMKEKLRVKGLVTVRVLDREGNVKRRSPTRRDYIFGFFKNLLRLKKPPPMAVVMCWSAMP